MAALFGFVPGDLEQPAVAAVLPRSKRVYRAVHEDMRPVGALMPAHIRRTAGPMCLLLFLLGRARGAVLGQEQLVREPAERVLLAPAKGDFGPLRPAGDPALCVGGHDGIV